MPEYTINLARTARRELESLENELAERIFFRIEGLAIEPQPFGCKKLKGEEKLWRIRVGDYRVIYSVNDAKKIVDVNHIRHRKDVYR